MRKHCFLLGCLLCTCALPPYYTGSIHAQGLLPDRCKLTVETNLAGLADFGTELPFVDLMRNRREWYPKSVGDPADPFSSGFADSLDLRPRSA